VRLSFALQADDLLLCNYPFANPIQCHDRSLSAVRVMRCRFCAAARAALRSALPQYPGFIGMALRHRYPLRNLDTAELPYCDLGSYLAQVQSGRAAHLDACMQPHLQPRLVKLRKVQH
jgi:hypothetical protein